jgi:TonB family protein
MRDDAVQAILIHEIAHLRRNDVWTNAFARVGEALAALNPAAWFIMRRLAAEREIACDDWVIARTGDGGAFAQALATLAGGAAVRVPIAAAGAIGSRHSIVVRIERLLDSRPRHLRLSLSALGGTLMLLALIAFTVQSVSPALAIAPLAGPSSYHTATTTVAGCTRDRTPLREHRLGAGGPRMISPSLDAGSMQRIVARYPAFTTTYAVSVSAAGKPHDVVILHPSKDLAEDRAVAAAALSSTFEPAFHNCAAVASTFRSASTQLPAPTVFLITRPATPVIYGTKPKTRTGACAVPHHDPAIVHLVRPEFTDSMKKLVLATQRTYLNTVNVQLDASGAVQNAMVGKSSGRKAFDEATLAAARETTYAPRVEHCSHIPGTYFVMAAYTDRLEP